MIEVWLDKEFITVCKVKENDPGFPDGTPHIVLTPEYITDSKEHFSIDYFLNSPEKEITITWRYENMGELFKLYSICRFFQNKKPGIEINLSIPYFPNARMDRVKNPEDIFTLKYCAEIINSIHAKTVIILDPHSDITPALVENSRINNAKSFIERAINDFSPDILFFPDNGAAKKYSSFIEFKHGFGVKDRDWKTGTIRGLKIEGDVEGKRVLIVDDICSKGGTFFHSAKALREAGAKDVALYVTHCEKTIEEGNLLKDEYKDLISKIYTTDSLPGLVPNEKIEVFHIKY